MSDNLTSAVVNDDQRLSVWWAVAGVLAVFVALWAYTLAVIRPLPLDIDAALFLHAGWYINQGARLYLDIWDTLPPLTIETSAALAWLSGGNLNLLYALGLLAHAAGYAGLVLLAGGVTWQVTGSRKAGYVAGLVMLVFTVGYFFPFPGYRIKAITLALGWLGVYLQLRDRPFWSGVSAAAAVGFAQLSITFALIVFILSLRDKRQLWQMLAGAAVASAIVLLPIVIWGAVPAMVEEAILSHLKTSLSEPLWVSGLKVAFHLKTGAAVLVLGLYALARRSVLRLRDLWPLMLILVWFLVFLLALDYDGPEDLLALVMVASVGLGMAVEHLSVRQTAAVAAVSVVLLIAGARPLDAYASQTMTDMYWNRVIPDSCHYRLGNVERQYIERYGDACPEPQWALRRP